MRNYFVFNYLVVIVMLLTLSCKNRPEDKPSDETGNASGITGRPEVSVLKDTVYDPATKDEEMAAKISGILLDRFQEELGAMEEVDRRFQMYKVNLDADPGSEVFIRFMSPYFCGSGGCTFLLLDDTLELITKFTVTRPPLFVENTMVNDWKIILVKSEGAWKELKNNGEGYPGNPTILPPAPYDAPSANALIIFGDMNAGLPSKTYGF